MRYKQLAFGLVMVSTNVSGDHHDIADHHVEEIVVSAPFQKSNAETAMPVGILSGETLRKAIANNLGDSLNGQVGVHGASFGPGVGHVVIRGQSGNRVQVMQNSVNVTDASAISPDHANGIEPLLAKRLEVVRGPSTLLYGNGAVGGIINVVDGRVPEEIFDVPGLIAEQSYDSVSHENKTVGRLEVSMQSVSLYLAGSYRDNNDVDIPGLAIDESAVHAGHEPEEDFTNTDGVIANSKGRSKTGTVGVSWIGHRGFLGLALSKLGNDYGLPPGAHPHEEESGIEESADDEAFDEFVRIELTQRRYDLTGEYRFKRGLIESVRGTLSHTDYEHKEIELGDSTSIGTEFLNDGLDGRIVFDLVPVGLWAGIVGFQFSDTTFSALGDESFIPETEKDAMALFAMARAESDRWTWEFGARVERFELDPGRCDVSETTTSLGVSMLYDISQDQNVSVGFSRSERAPTIEERYSNIRLSTCTPPENLETAVFHAATGQVEIGDVNLSRETSRNLELGFRKHRGKWTTELNAYYNQIQDYMLLASTEPVVDHQPVSAYRSADSTFYGLGAKLSRRVSLSGGNDLVFRLQGDLVRADFDQGGHLPRIPPARTGAGLAYDENNWSLDISVMRSFAQSRTTENEQSTDGYTALSFYADYHVELGGNELLVFIKGSNLLDEEIRNHTSFLKHYAPEPGRNIRVGIRFSH